MRYHGTDIDGPSLEPERLNVRGRDLNDLIGTLSYPSAVFHLLAGREPSPAEEAALDAWLLRAAVEVGPSPEALRIARAVVLSGASVSRALVAAYMVEVADLPARLGTPEGPGFGEDHAVGLYDLAVAPLVLAAALSPEPPPAAGGDYVAAVFHALTGRQPSALEGRVFHASLVSLHAGFGFLTPTVMLPRGAISTRVPIPQAIAAGFAAAGPAHVGACEDAMVLLQRLREGGDGAMESRAAEEVERAGAERRRIPGFGHPLFQRDPRPPRLRQLLAETSYESPFLRAYDLLAAAVWERQGIAPNIDSVSAAIFLSLGIGPGYGTGLFLCSRTAAMLAHVLEKKAQPPFGLRSETARRLLGSTAQTTGTAELALIQEL